MSNLYICKGKLYQEDDTYEYENRKEDEYMCDISLFDVVVAADDEQKARIRIWQHFKETFGFDKLEINSVEEVRCDYQVYEIKNEMVGQEIIKIKGYTEISTENI